MTMVFGLTKKEIEERLYSNALGFHVQIIPKYCVLDFMLVVPLEHSALVSELFQDYIYSVSGESLSGAVMRLLSQKQMKITFAESCTGGLLSKLITDNPGSSSVFDCGVVAYRNEIKHQLLGVRTDTLEKYGAVSEQTAREMAGGIYNASGADLAVSVTGIAGPDGGTQDKPVGLAYMCLWDGECAVIQKFNSGIYTDTRGEFRKITAYRCLKTVYDYLVRKG